MKGIGVLTLNITSFLEALMERSHEGERKRPTIRCCETRSPGSTTDALALALATRLQRYREA